MSHRSYIKLVFGVVVLGLAAGCGTRERALTPLDHAKQLLFERKVADARAKCDEILAKDPTNYDAMLLRGQINEKDDDVDQALADYSKAIELGPTRPDGYDVRYHLYMKLAERESDTSVRRVLEEAAAADYANLRAYDPSAIIAFKNEVRTVPESLKKPIPSYDPPSEVETPPVLGMSDDAETSAVTQQDAASSDTMDQGQETPPNTADRWTTDQSEEKGKSDEEQITERDLGDGSPPEPTLPPHLDPLIKDVLPETTEPHITRFDLQSFSPLPFVAPSPDAPQSAGRPPRGTTTGITQPQVDSPRDTSQPRTRFFLQQPFGPTGFTSGLPRAAGRSTGIQSGSWSGRSPLLSGTQTFGPTGFLPPSAQGVFGPRLATPQQPAPGHNENGSTSPRRTPAAGAPILTTAIPGTTLIYGSGAQGSTRGVQYAPDLTDPTYSPFVPRPTGIQTVPDLPNP